MNFELPLYRQQKDETCALACLRMVLAVHGKQVTESAIEAEARLEKGGTPIEELDRLAKHFGLVGQIQHASVDQLRAILARGDLPIVYLNRTVFALPSLRHFRRALKDVKVHAVIPTHISNRFVTFHDPLGPRVGRRSIKRFEFAQRFVNDVTLVCENPRQRYS